MALEMFVFGGERTKVKKRVLTKKQTTKLDQDIFLP